jgi:hypothetical protein
MRKKIYKKIIELLTAEDLIKHVDLWNEKVQYESEQSWECPAVFVEFLPIQWKNLASPVQDADITFRLHIVTRALEPTHSGASETDLNAGLEYLGLLEQINCRIHYFAGEGINHIIHLQSVTNHNHEEIIESIEDYVVHVVDNSVYDYSNKDNVYIVAKQKHHKKHKH